MIFKKLVVLCAVLSLATHANAGLRISGLPHLTAKSVAWAEISGAGKEPDKDVKVAHGLPSPGSQSVRSIAMQSETATPLVIHAVPVISTGSLTHRPAMGKPRIWPIDTISCGHDVTCTAAGAPVSFPVMHAHGQSSFEAEGYVGGIRKLNRIVHIVHNTVQDDMTINNSFELIVTKPNGTKVTVTGMVTSEGVSGKIDGVPFTVIHDGVNAELPPVYAPNYSDIKFRSSGDVSIWKLAPDEKKLGISHLIMITNVDSEDEPNPPLFPPAPPSGDF